MCRRFKTDDDGLGSIIRKLRGKPLEAITVICEFERLREYYAIRRYDCGLMVEFGNVNAYVNHRGTPPFQKSLIL